MGDKAMAQRSTFYALCLVMISFVSCIKLDHRVSIENQDPRGQDFFRGPAAVSDSSPVRVITNDGEVLRLLFSKNLPNNLYYRLSLPDGSAPIVKPARHGELHQIQVETSGIYRFELYADIPLVIYEHYVASNRKVMSPVEVWQQDIFVQADRDFTLSAKEIEAIANRHAPIVLLHQNEKFIPSSLSYIFNQEDPSTELKQENFKLSFEKKRFILADDDQQSSQQPSSNNSLEFSFEDIVPVLAQLGTTDALLDIGTWQKINSHIQRRYGRPEGATIYYLYFERDRKLYISYYFLYSFDPKNVLFNPLVTHIFDRESYTMVYDLDQSKPDYLVYFSHLPNQTIGMGDEQKKNFKKWKGGKLYLNWHEVPTSGDRPIISIAEGSHAIYPFPGNYGVFPVGAVVKLVEEAGGTSKILVPRGDQYHSISNSYLMSYRLVDMEAGKITSESWNNMLGFSGKFIDIFSVPFLSRNLNFPPFTEREKDIYNQTSRDTTHHFDTTVVPSSSWGMIKHLQTQLKIFSMP